jgi:hypothetical protein
VLQQEGAGAVGVLRLSGAKTRLPEGLIFLIFSIDMRIA